VERTENSSRERILQRIRSALTASVTKAPEQTAAEIFSPVSNQLERFQAECANNNTEVIVTDDASGTAAAIVKVLGSLAPGEAFLQDAPALRHLAANWPTERVLRWSSEGRLAESSQVTITLADWLVAQTGSIFVSSACGGRAASVAAPVHIVVAHETQLVPDLAVLFTQVNERGTAVNHSMLCLITGSSRTADIEKILVLGAHGPKRLVVVLQRGGAQLP